MRKIWHEGNVDPNNAPCCSHFAKRELGGESIRRLVRVIRASVGRRRIEKWRLPPRDEGKGEVQGPVLAVSI